MSATRELVGRQRRESSGHKTKTVWRSTISSNPRRASCAGGLTAKTVSKEGFTPSPDELLDLGGQVLHITVVVGVDLFALQGR